MLFVLNMTRLENSSLNLKGVRVGVYLPPVLLEEDGSRYYLEGELHMKFKTAMRGAKRNLTEEWDSYRDYCPQRYNEFKSRYLR